DGVILGPGFSEGEKKRLRDVGITILAVYDAPADLAVDGQARDVDVVYTGVVPVVYKAQRELLNSLIESTLWSFSTITPLMMFVCGGVLAGLVVGVPNALPVLVVFGGMGWLGIRVDIGSMMAASIALGVAVDDTIHFLAWFRGDYKVLNDRRMAILSAYRRSATATLQAALINGLGLSVFATSSFTPTQRFGWLMLVILVAGMAAELIMLPSILFSRLGRVFETKRRADEPPPADDELAIGMAPAADLRIDNGEAPANGAHAHREHTTPAQR
ncbi:MAG TPA: MMPL family transporter, partial [Lacipirellulaceae bacterium]|nr:MMPL family transporter [Lacipirellulaceae bacterium]